MNENKRKVRRNGRTVLLTILYFSYNLQVHGVCSGFKLAVCRYYLLLCNEMV